jgi:lipopolysaccharide biosynthesis glycosyltransferase
MGGGMAGKFNVVLCVDDSYAQYASVVIESILQNTSEEISVYLYAVGLKDDTRKKLKRQTVQHNQLGLEIIEENEDYLDTLPTTNSHVNKYAYLTLRGISQIPSDVKRVVYLDADLVVNTDISELFASFQENKIGGVREVKDEGKSLLEKKGIEGDKYYNTGVMLIDRQYWADRGVFQEAKNYLVNLPENINYHFIPEQDALNYVFGSDWYALSPSWNPRTVNEKDGERYEPDEIRKKIVHYSGPHKPWNYLCRHPKRDLFWEFEKNSPFNIHIEDRNTVNICKKSVQWLLSFTKYVIPYPEEVYEQVKKLPVLRKLYH